MPKVNASPREKRRAGNRAATRRLYAERRRLYEERFGTVAYLAKPMTKPVAVPVHGMGWTGAD